MCLSVPWRVEAVGIGVADVSHGPHRRTVSLLLLLDEPVAVGDYLLVQVGDLAAERLSPAAAEDALSLLAEIDCAAAA